MLYLSQQKTNGPTSGKGECGCSDRAAAEKKMDYFEKVEKLVEKAGVTFEEAKQALDESNGDMLDAMILLERSGKTQGPKNSTYSTKYEDQSAYYAASEKTEENSFGEKLKAFGKKAWDILSRNYLNVSRGEETVIRLPLWAAALILLSAWYVAVILIIVSLFFDFRYSFSGEADMKSVNEIMDKAAEAAEKAKEEFKE